VNKETLSILTDPAAAPKSKITRALLAPKPVAARVKV
jgi:hypothetical protein